MSEQISPGDLSACDREPIHVPGAIQPHGALLAWDERRGTRLVAAAGTETFTGRRPDEWLGKDLSEVLDDASAQAVTDHLRRGDLTGVNPLPIRWRRESPAAAGEVFDGILHRHGGLALLETEARCAPDGNLFHVVQSAVRRLQAADSRAALCDAMAREVRRLTGFDRVMIYRFGEEWDGEVVAEDRSESAVGYLGHRFPASDIPAQARALYAQNPVRCIPDANYTPAPIAVDPRCGEPIDLSFSVLRSVSPVHIEYLRNMAVQASMSISVLRDGRLWGLIACHHASPRFLPYEVQQACELLGQIFAGHLQAVEQADVHAHLGTFRRIADQLVRDMAVGGSLQEALARQEETLLRLTGAGGLALISDDGTVSIGGTPAQQEIAALLDWLRDRVEAPGLETDRLPSVYAPAADFPETASGLLAMALSPDRGQYLLWFRPQFVHTIRWGGCKDQPAYLGTAGKRLHPRKSFETWVEEVHGRSAPWERRHVAVAHAVKDLVTDVLLRQAAERERLVRRLARSNDQLESFVYAVAHDLRSPLTYVTGYTELLQARVPSGDPTSMAGPLRKMAKAAERMAAMLDELTGFAKITREGEDFQPVPLDDVLSDVLDAVQPDLAGAAATVERQPLPTALCDPAQIRHVFQNLVLNAVKYRDAGRAPVIRVGVPERAADAASRRDRVWVFVADNGIGFEMTDRERIFQPFQQLALERKEGSGMGLAICRRIVLRHGGEIEAFGAPGEGAVFHFSLPAPPAAAPPDFP